MLYNHLLTIYSISHSVITYLSQIRFQFAFSYLKHKTLRIHRAATSITSRGKNMQSNASSTINPTIPYSPQSSTHQSISERSCKQIISNATTPQQLLRTSRTNNTPERKKKEKHRPRDKGKPLMKKKIHTRVRRCDICGRARHAANKTNRHYIRTSAAARKFISRR